MFPPHNTRVKFFAASLLLLTVFVYGRGQGFDFTSRVGVVVPYEEGKPCLIIWNPALAKGISLSLIVLSRPQWAAKAKIREKLAQNCSRNEMIEGASFYRLEVNSIRDIFKLTNRLPPVIAVESSTRSVVRNGTVSIDLERDGQPEFFRDCASGEGMHLTVWSGTPLKGKRRWHFYYYLGYDTIFTCKKKDYM